MLRLTPLPLLAVVFALVPAPAADPVPVAPPPRPVLDAGLDRSLADWTPRPATGKAEPWELATDKDWTDPRFRAMDTGPFLNCTMDYPRDKGKERVFKATVIKLGQASGGREPPECGVVFDRCTMRLAAGWTGGWLNITDRRFGLLNTPTPKGKLVFATPAGPGWADPNGKWDVGTSRFTTPLPATWAKYRGLYVHGDRVILNYTVGSTEVLESPGITTIDGKRLLVADLQVGASAAALECLTVEFDREHAIYPAGDAAYDFAEAGKQFRLAGRIGRGSLEAEQVAHSRWKGHVTFPSTKERQRVRLFFAEGTIDEHNALHEAIDKLKPAADLRPLTKGGPTRWGPPIVTKLERGKEGGPFAIDTLTLPFDNPHKALFFCTGLDFLPDGRVAVCTAHGDVWLAKIDEAAGTVSWQRFATGLYQPLGLRVVGGKVVVLERGQLTRLQDLNGDGEADFYECLCNDWHTGGGEHSYDTCLETDPQGNFYFFKTGDTNLPHGGCLLKVSPDGRKVDVFATGFRHPIGLGVSPTGIVTGADQEGNWMPATRIDQYKPGGFYGDMRAHHRATPPTTYDVPVCWVPREVDNSAGGQVWVPQGKWGPLGGLPLHLSYGRCKAFVLLRQELPDGRVQGGVADLGLNFLSGVCRGRFSPADGHLYVCGLNGWQTSAQADGCLQRVRYTGKPIDVPVKLAVEGKEVRLTFGRALSRAAAEDADNFRAAAWNYRWSGDYGSKRWKVSDLGSEGQDDVPVRRTRLSEDGRTVVVEFEREVQPAMQLQVAYNLKAADGPRVVGSVFLTVHDKGR